MSTTRKRFWMNLQKSIRELSRIFGLEIRVDLSSPVAYYFLETDLSKLFQKGKGKVEFEDEDTPFLSRFINSNSTVLDVGCGTGRVIRNMAPLCKKIYGLDTSRISLKLAEKTMRSKNVQLVHGDCTNMKMFTNSMFNLIFSRAVIVHLSREDTFLMLRESKRLLKPNGITSHDFPLLSDYWNQFAQRAILRDFSFMRPKYYTLEEIKIIFNRLNFEIIEIKKRRHGNIIVVARKRDSVSSTRAATSWINSLPSQSKANVI